MMKKKIFISIICLIFVIVCCLFVLNRQNKKQNELVFWTLQLGTFSKYIEPIIDKFEHEHPEIKVVWVDIPYSEGGKRTLASILSNTPPDLINATPDFTTLLAQRNTLYSFSPSDVEQYEPSIMNALTLDSGKSYYSIPFYATTAVTYYNKSLTEKAEIKKMPENYEEMYDLAESTLDKTKAYVTMPTLNENDTFLKILNKYDLANERDINSDKSINIIKEYKKLYEKGYIPKESLTQTHRDALEKYMSGQIVFYNGGANFLGMIKENAPTIYETTDILPQMVGDNKKFDYSLMNLIIPQNAKNKELALEFAKLLTNKENQLKFAKMTTIMPVNKYTLDDDYFKHDNGDLQSKARIISAGQLKNTLKPIDFKDQKGLILKLNKAIAEIILGKKEVNIALNELQTWWYKNK